MIDNNDLPSKSVYIKDLAEGQLLKDIFAVSEARQAQSKNGPYWNLQLQDCSGQINAKIWSPLSSQFAEIKVEELIMVEGQVQKFRDQLQVVIKNLHFVDTSSPSFDWSQFIPCSATAPEELLAQLEYLCQEQLSYQPWRKLCRLVLRDEKIRSKLLAAPGAKSIHHAYMGGLLEHTLAVCKLCLSIADHYPSLDREILLVAGIFHDLGKAWELEGTLSRQFSDQGRLLGHIYITLNLLESFFPRVKGLDEDLVLHLKHLIISHHGEYEFGSPKRPKTPEAMALHYADNLDAKLNTMQQVLDEMDEDRWSSYQRSLERPLYRAQTTPVNKKNTPKQKPKVQQCLLPLKE
jgi:3'-5' exoribonuclease